MVSAMSRIWFFAFGDCSGRCGFGSGGRGLAAARAGIGAVAFGCDLGLRMRRLANRCARPVGFMRSDFSCNTRAGWSAAGQMGEHFFVEPAPANRYRVVFVGASTVQGFPHPRRLAAASFLQAMLADAWPEREVEVVNLGITSIASFAVARGGRRCVGAVAGSGRRLYRAQ